MPEDVMTNETASPVTAGASTAPTPKTKKAPAKKAAPSKKTAPAKKAAPSKKTAPAKKAPAAKPASNGHTRFEGSETIHTKSTFDAAAFRGSRGERAKYIKDGATVTSYLNAVEKAGFERVRGLAMLHLLIASELITVK